MHRFFFFTRPDSKAGEEKSSKKVLRGVFLFAIRGKSQRERKLQAQSPIFHLTQYPHPQKRTTPGKQMTKITSKNRKSGIFPRSPLKPQKPAPPHLSQIVKAVSAIPAQTEAFRARGPYSETHIPRAPHVLDSKTIYWAGSCTTDGRNQLLQLLGFHRP